MNRLFRVCTLCVHVFVPCVYVTLCTCGGGLIPSIGRAEVYLMGCTFSFYKSRGATLLGKENRKILHSGALINEFHRLAPAALCVKCTGSNPFYPGGFNSMY